MSEVGSDDIVEYRAVRRKKTGAVIRRIPVVVGTRKILQARIFGSQELMTAVVYSGPDFEKESTSFQWNMHILKSFCTVEI